MKNKRKVLSMLLTVAVLGTSFVMSSTEKLDETLEQAEEFAQTLFETELGKEEQESKELLEILGEEEKDTKGGYIHASYLQGLDGEEDYILVQRENGGYAIFEKESMEVIEYSNLSSAPYQGLLVDRYYAGPANYYEKKDGKIKNVHTGETFKEEKLSEIAKNIKNDLKKNREKRKEKKSEKGIVASNKLLMTSSGYYEGDPLNPADFYTAYNRKYIPDYQFFIGNNYMGDNSNAGDSYCASVAAQLLLTYNNWIKDGRIIPENNDLELTNGEQFFFGDRYTNFDKPYSDAMKKTTIDETTNDNLITFYEAIKDYVNHVDAETGKQASIWSNGVLNLSVQTGIRKFLNKYSTGDCADEISLSSNSLTTVSNAKSVLVDEIDVGRPAIASIRYYDATSSGYEKGGHCILVYGYQTVIHNNEHLDGMIAHFGWSKATSNVWVNSDWLNGYVTMETEHEHGDLTMPFKTVTGETNTHILRCTLCGVTYANAEHTYNGTNAESLPISYEEYYTHHQENCSSCLYKGMVEHTPNGIVRRIPSTNAELNNLYEIYHLEGCLECYVDVLVKHDFSNSYTQITTAEEKTHHGGSCVCGVSRLLPHEYTQYRSRGSLPTHAKICHLCGYEIYEPHVYREGWSVCFYCQAPMI